MSVFEKELHRQKDSPSKRAVNKILEMNSILDLTVIKWLNSVLCRPLSLKETQISNLVKSDSHFALVTRRKYFNVNKK